MKHIYFCRHGLSEMNRLGVWSGQVETPLTAEGRDQARAAGKQAKKLGIDHIVASPYSRAQDTARIIAEIIDLPPENVELNSLFIERSLGVLEGQPWDPDLNIDGFADIETTDTLLHRMKLAYAHLQAMDHENILVVGHGASGRMLRHIINPNIPFMGEGSKPFGNAEIVQLA